MERQFIETMLTVGGALERSVGYGKHNWFQRARTHLHSLQYDLLLYVGSEGLISSVTASHDELKNIIRFAELSLQQYEARCDRTIAKAWTERSQMLLRKRMFSRRAYRRVTIAELYQRFGVGDTSQDFDKAFEHYQAAATLLEQGGAPLAALHAAGIRAQSARARLNYLTNDRQYHAQEAIADLKDAKRLLTSLTLSMVDPPKGKGILELLSFVKIHGWSSLISTQRWAMDANEVKRIPTQLREFAISQALKTGKVNAGMSGLLVQPYLAQLDWQLGIAHRQLDQSDTAIAHFRMALNELPSGLPDLRAQIETDMGYSYLERSEKDRSEHLAFAAESFSRAMVCCVDNGSVPYDRIRAYVRALIGNAHVYFERHPWRTVETDQHRKDLQTSVKCLRTAARLARKVSALPLLRDALFLLGRAHEQQKDSLKAYRALALAVRIADRLHRQVRTTRLRRALIKEEANINELLIRTAFSHNISCRKSSSSKKNIIPLQRIFLYAERGRTRFLESELARELRLPRDAQAEDLSGFATSRRLWHESEFRLLEEERVGLADVNSIEELRRQKTSAESRYHEELQKIRIRFNDPDYDPDKPLFATRFAELFPDIRHYLQRNRAVLIEFYLTSSYLVAFVVFPQYITYETIRIPPGELAKIQEHWRRGLEALDGSPSPAHWERGYLNQVLDRLRPITTLTRLIREWEETKGESIDRIVMIPHRFLHLVPLHSVPLPDGRAWGDTITIQYTPSASALRQLLCLGDLEQARPKNDFWNSHANKVVSYSAPGHSLLPFCGEEAKAVNKWLPGAIFQGKRADPAGLIDSLPLADYIHFACHGVFDNQNPLDSALLLAASKGDPVGRAASSLGSDSVVARYSRFSDGRLRLGDIIRELELPFTRTVVLSACDTGRVRLEDLHQEHIGFPAAFLCAGARAVVCTLWKVNDVATWLLMRAFARELSTGRDLSQALRLAQQELRTLSKAHVVQEIVTVAQEESNATRRALMLEISQSIQQGSEMPFASPYWWAGFTVNGLI